MLVHISQELVNVLVLHARVCYPLEACGLIAGESDGDKKIVRKIYPLHNTKQSRVHFGFAPKEQQTAVKDIRALNMSVLGIFHSRPDSPAEPTADDIDLSPDYAASCLILSLKTTIPVLKAYHVDKKTGQVEEETLVVEPMQATP